MAEPKAVDLSGLMSFMRRNALQDETRTVQRRVPRLTDWFPDKVRLSPTVARILDALRSEDEDLGEQLVFGALKSAFTRAIQDGRYTAVYAALGTLLRRDVPNGVCLRCGAPGIVDGIPNGTPVPRRDVVP